MQVVRKKSFVKSYARLPRVVQDKTDEILLLFEKDPRNSALHNHWLKWNRDGYHSINVTWDYRIIFRELGKRWITIKVDLDYNVYCSISIYYALVVQLCVLDVFTKGTSFASSSRTIVLCNGEHMTANLLRCPDGYTRLTRLQWF